MSETIKQRYVELLKSLKVIDPSLDFKAREEAFNHNKSVLKRWNILDQNLGFKVTLRQVSLWL